MSDTPAKSEARGNRPAVSPSEGIEQLVLLSHTLTRAAAGPLAAAGLTLDSYAILVSLGAEDGSASSRMAKRATPSGAAAREPRASLVKAGLVQESKQEGGRSYALTEAGTRKLAELRAAIGGLGSTIEESSLRPMPRIANLVRQAAKALEGGSEAKAKGPEAKAERAAKKAAKRGSGTARGA